MSRGRDSTARRNARGAPQVEVEARVLGGVHVRLHAEPAEGDGRAIRPHTELPHQFQAVTVWQSDIADDHVDVLEIDALRRRDVLKEFDVFGKLMEPMQRRAPPDSAPDGGPLIMSEIQRAPSLTHPLEDEILQRSSAGFTRA